MTPDEEKACTTEAFLVAVGQVGSDPAKAATDLSVFAPDPSVLAIDEAVMGPQGAGRTAELFAQRTTPLATILCLAAEYRRASCPGTVMMLEGPTNEVLSHPQLGEHARYMPTLITQWATSMMEKNAIGEPAHTLPLLERLVDVLGTHNAGITGAHVCLLRAYVDSSEYDKAIALCQRVDVFQTDSTSQALDILAFVCLAAHAYEYRKEINTAMAYWHNALSLPTNVIHPWQIQAVKKLVVAYVIRDGRVPAMPRMLPLASASLHAQYGRDTDWYWTWAKYATSTHMESARTAQQLADEHRSALENEDMWRLVQQALHAQKMHWILALPPLYKTIPLARIAEYVDWPSEDVERILADLTTQGRLHATIYLSDIPIPSDALPVPGGYVTGDPGRHWVRFDDPPPSPSMQHAWEEVLAKEKAATQTLHALKHQAYTSPGFLSRIITLNAGAATTVESEMEAEMA